MFMSGIETQKNYPWSDKEPFTSSTNSFISAKLSYNHGIEAELWLCAYDRGDIVTAATGGMDTNYWHPEDQVERDRQIAIWRWGEEDENGS